MLGVVKMGWWMTHGCSDGGVISSVFGNLLWSVRAPIHDPVVAGM